MLNKKIMTLAKELEKELINIRRHIHSHPEIAYKEFKTSNYIIETLKKHDIKDIKNIGDTGVLVTIKGKEEGKCLLLRADMDSLNINEKTNLGYRSLYPGLMHACGHDAHVAWSIGAAIILKELKNSFNGSVKIFFQPAEEIGGGMKEAIQGGILYNPKVNCALTAHVWPNVSSGKVVVKPDILMGASAHFKILIRGKGGHGAMPNKCIDSITIASQIQMAIQSIVSRETDPFDPIVISTGKFIAGNSRNIIPEEALMEGIIRTISFESRNKVYDMMKSIVEGITKAYGATYTLEYIPKLPPIINDKSLSLIMKKSCENIIGKDNVMDTVVPSLISDNFALLQQEVPGVYMWIGTLNKEKGIDKPLHSPLFNIDEDIIYKTSAVLSGIIINYLNC